MIDASTASALGALQCSKECTLQIGQSVWCTIRSTWRSDVRKCIAIAMFDVGYCSIFWAPQAYHPQSKSHNGKFELTHETVSSNFMHHKANSCWMQWLCRSMSLIISISKRLSLLVCYGCLEPPIHLWSLQTQLVNCKPQDRPEQPAPSSQWAAFSLWKSSMPYRSRPKQFGMERILIWILSNGSLFIWRLMWHVLYDFSWTVALWANATGGATCSPQQHVSEPVVKLHISDFSRASFLGRNNR